jgi:glycosyltransferase involved in cell wall biosynthesis
MRKHDYDADPDCPIWSRTEPARLGWTRSRSPFGSRGRTAGRPEGRCFCALGRKSTFGSCSRGLGDAKYQSLGVDKSIFHPRDRTECRHALGLLQSARLIGTAGSLHADKGVGTLYAAHAQLAAEDPSSHLVLAGPFDKRLPPPTGSRVHCLGLLARQQATTFSQAQPPGRCRSPSKPRLLARQPGEEAPGYAARPPRQP